MAPQDLHPPQRGVSLVEALVAMAVMAFGMLALVGVQSTMRLNSDVSKQRTEATRIANEEIEQLRVAIVTAAIAGQADPSWDGITSRVLDPYVPPDGIGNTSYRVVRTILDVPLIVPNGAVPVVPPSRQKVAQVRVSWTDRTGLLQEITVDSMIAGVAPGLSSLLSVAPRPSATNQANGRHVSVPGQAVDLHSGRSAFKPFDSGSVVWVFNNATGVIVSRCTGVTTVQAAIALADLSNCITIDGRRLSGTVQFDLGSPPSSESPAGPSLPLTATEPVRFSTAGISPVNQVGRAAECVAKSPASLAAGAVGTALGFAVPYECVVFPDDASGWGGKLDVRLASSHANGDLLPGGSVPADFKVCRYTADLPSADDTNADFTLNLDHPKSYCMEKPGTATADVPCSGKRVTGNLINQNFLVIRTAEACPADGSNPRINGNTRQHQPTP